MAPHGEGDESIMIGYALRETRNRTRCSQREWPREPLNPLFGPKVRLASISRFRTRDWTARPFKALSADPRDAASRFCQGERGKIVWLFSHAVSGDEYLFIRAICGFPYDERSVFIRVICGRSMRW